MTSQVSPSLGVLERQIACYKADPQNHPVVDTKKRDEEVQPSSKFSDLHKRKLRPQEENKLRFCLDYLKNKCTKGKNCPYPHLKYNKNFHRESKPIPHGRKSFLKPASPGNKII